MNLNDNQTYRIVEFISLRDMYDHAGWVALDQYMGRGHKRHMPETSKQTVIAIGILR